MGSPLPPDPYKLLGVSKDASLAEIRSSHRKLVLKCHPDKVQDAALKAAKQDEFQKVQQAYELLSDDAQRLKYDDQVKLFELRKEMAGRNGPTARSNPFEYEIRTAEPRPGTYSRPMPRDSPKVYSHTPPRSYEDMLYEEQAAKVTPKKSTSYEERKRPSTKDEDRQWELRKHEEEERAKQKREKDSKRAAHGERKKTRDKEKRRGVDEKHYRTNAAYVEEDDSDDYEVPAPRSDRKSTRRMEEEIRMRNEQAAQAEESALRQPALTPKWDVHKENAAKYMEAARRKVEKERDEDFHPSPIRRAESFGPSYTSMRYTAPLSPAFSPSDNEAPRRSSGRQKPSKESRRSPGASPREPYIVQPPSPPPGPKKPSLQTRSSAPPTLPVYSSGRKEPSRSKTAEYPRQDPGSHPLPRAATFHSDRDRSSRLKKTVAYDSDSEPESPVYGSPRHSHSPPRRRETSEQTRYIIDNGRTVPITRHRSDLHDMDDGGYARERSESPRTGRPVLPRNLGSTGSHHAATRSASQNYYPGTAADPIVITPGPPKFVSRDSTHRGGTARTGARFSDIKFTQNYGPEHVVYSTHQRPDHYRRGSDPSHHRDYGYPYRGGRGEVYT